MSQTKENSMENKRIYKKSVPPEHFGRKEIHEAPKIEPQRSTHAQANP